MRPTTSYQDVDYRHPAYTEYKSEWQLVSDCTDGTRAVKHRKMLYLPHPSSDYRVSDPNLTRYHAYIQRAPFVNATGRTLMGLLGIAFAKPVTVELSGDMQVLETDVDTQGQSLTQLMRDVLSCTLQHGRAGLLADYTGTGEQTVVTVGRPTLKLYKAKQIINWRVTDGKTSLVVLHEYTAEDLKDEFRLELVALWTELRMVDGVAHVRKWRKGVNGFTSTDLVPIRDKAGTPLKELPFVWVGASNNDHTPDAPPLADIAYMNIRHFQCEADIAEIAHLTGNPTATVTNLTHDWADKYLSSGIKVGSTAGLLLPVGGKLEIVQAEDRNMPITAAERCEKQLAMLGAKLVERGTAAKTATQAGDEAQTDNSILSLCAGNVEAAINKALEYVSAFVNGEGSVVLNKRYEAAQLDSQAITALLAALQSGKLLLTDFIRYLQGIGVCDPLVPAEEIETQLRAQSDIEGLSLYEETTQRQQPTPAGSDSAQPVREPVRGRSGTPDGGAAE